MLTVIYTTVYIFTIESNYYNSTSKKYQLLKSMNIGEECINLLNVPTGNHVLTIATNIVDTQQVATYVSHVVIF